MFAAVPHGQKCWPFATASTKLGGTFLVSPDTNDVFMKIRLERSVVNCGKSYRYAAKLNWLKILEKLTH
jgi:hypothetical protein